MSEHLEKYKELDKKRAQIEAELEKVLDEMDTHWNGMTEEERCEVDPIRKELKLIHEVMPVYYFGPLYESGHHLYSVDGYMASREEHDALPWTIDELDGTVQPGRRFENGRWVQRGPETEGEAVIHHKNDWTAMSFWDRTVDTRPGSSSTYIAKGIHTFEKMVEISRFRFPRRWGMMKFKVTFKREAP